MRKRIFRLLSALTVCALVSFFFWSWIFTFLTDTDRAHKVTIFADSDSFDGKALAIALEEDLPDGIRIIQAKPFSYALMDSASLETADLYLIPERDMAEYRKWLRPLPERFQSMAAGETDEETGADTGMVPMSAGLWEEEGTPYGLRLPDEKKGASSGILPEWEASDEAWYLCFGAGGFHLPSPETGEEGAALKTALRVLELITQAPDDK